MLSFVSLNYYYFLMLVAVLYFISKQSVRVYVLLLASYVFYFSYEPKYVVFIFTTTLVSYFSALLMYKITNQNYRQIVLFFALAVEFLLLFFTKYWNTFSAATGWLNPIDILVPLGISFYTFQTLGYLFDVYRAQLVPEKKIINYALFLSFFPHLLAGPIEPAQNFLSQIQNLRRFNLQNLAFGLMLILTGLFKKLVIADRLSHIVNLVFETPTDYHGLAVGLALFFARYQIYCDFSGYTDIALGSALIFGIKLTQNFNRPFFATSISDYWQKWHISLALWIRSYVFYPLVNTPLARLGAHALIFITFVFLGLWHGGTFNFMIYACWHSLFVILDSTTKTKRILFYNKFGFAKYPNLFKLVFISCTFFLLVVPPTLFFRSPNLSTTALLIKRFAGPWASNNLNFITESLFLFYCAQVALIAIFFMELTHWLVAKYNLINTVWVKSKVGFMLCLFILFTIIAFYGYFEPDSKFIYMRF